MEAIAASDLFSTSDFPARWDCGSWTLVHGWTHIVSDLLTAAAYFAIPTLILLYKARRPDVSFPLLFWLFGVFILACGAVHLVEASLFWYPWYRFSALLKVITAVVSVITVGALVRILPGALNLPGLAETNTELEKSEAVLRTTLDACTNFIGLMQPDGVLIAANKTALAASGTTESEVLGKYFWETPWWSHSVELQEQLKSAVAEARSGSRVGFTASHPTPDGSLIHVDFTLTPVIAAGQVVSIIPEGKDITERLNSENELRQLNADLGRSNRDLEQFAFLASHDLQEPLRTVVNVSTMLREDYGDRIGEEGMQIMELMDKAVCRMQSQIHELLTHSRIGHAATVEDVDFGLIAGQIQDSLRVAISESSAQIRVGPLPILPACESEIQLLLQNIVSNSIKFREPSRQLEIEISAREREDDWEFTVADNGVGIDPTQTEKAFALFKQLHSQVKQLHSQETYGGTGIGLAHCQKIVESHGGTIRVESSLGMGCQLLFTIPKVSPR